MTGNEYQQKANATASEPNAAVQQRLVNCAGSMKRIMSTICECAEDMDKIKKYAFYNKQNGMEQFDPEPFDNDRQNERLRNQAELLHAVIGIITEAGELADALFVHICDGKELDTVNVMEELGDLDWYKVLGLKAIGYTNEQCQDRNIEKLEARYNGKFTESAANNRDLATEREILENVKQQQDSNT